MSSRSMYNNINANVTAGTTRPVTGTRMEGTNEAAYIRMEGTNEAVYIKFLPMKQTTIQQELTAKFPLIF